MVELPDLNIEELARQALQESPDGNGRLRAAWRACRAEVMGRLQDPAQRGAMARGLRAVDPGEDRVIGGISPIGGALSAVLGSMAFRGGLSVVGRVIGADLSILAVPAAVLGGAFGTWVCLAHAEGSRKSIKAAAALSAASVVLPWRGRLMRAAFAAFSGARLWVTRPMVRFDEEDAVQRICLAIRAELTAIMSAELAGVFQTIPGKLTSSIRDLSRSSSQDRDAAVGALLDAARSEGVQGLDGPKTFCWEAGSEDLYETFGLVEPGDWVKEERPPETEPSGAVRRGLVRKVKR
ncbi:MULTISPECIES: hypothetical protein [Jonquetella]|uniref:Uncharacterized protein n=1 Tax=Jonquetella anthropi DSM 22815 TaxID=885272 RepID=H0ULM1_9BACT|nr:MULTISPECIES: hypothetical protein [Jonquetella]EHM12486.1 hypothetical protein JonanDRAFT_0051 [Jonquetella anthropi DSM 22815]ERL24799.1 hypothetical protein HMPREF1249_0751 [Jonquetella sp. BV3C21]